jgi:hypothetical protein
MTITFENNNDVIVYALEKVIAYARRIQQIFAAQCVWWLASVIGLKQRLIVHIDNLRTRFDSATHPENLTVIAETIPHTAKPDCQDKVLKKCEEFLRDSSRLRNLATRKATGCTKTGRINPVKVTK